MHLEHSQEVVAVKEYTGGKSSSNRVWRGCAGLIIIIGLLVLPRLVEPTPLAAQTCTQPSDQDIAMTFCDATHNDIAAEYPGLYDVNINVVVPPIILKAMGWYETWESRFSDGGGWLQCVNGRPVTSTDSCAWGLMQIWTGMNCDAPGSQFSAATQQAVKYDYRYNIAMGTYLLVYKWHERRPNQWLGDGSPGIAEHWYFAVWAYNGWGKKNHPNDLDFHRVYPIWDNPTTYPYQEVVWWLAAHPQHRTNGPDLWSPVNLTLPDRSLFPSSPYDPVGYFPDPLPTHRDWCRNCLPLVLKNYHTDTYEPNGSFGQAWPIETGTYESYIWHATDKDYYKFTPTRSGAIHVELHNIPAGCDYDLYLYNGAYQLIAQSTHSGNQSEHLESWVSPGNYYILVKSWGGSYSQTSPYRLHLYWIGKATAPYPPP